MKLEQQVVSLELAQKMKELGFKQESLFSYERYVIEKHNPKVPVIHYHAGHTTRVKQQYASNLYFVSAYTVAELGELLPKNVSFPIPQREAKGWIWRNEDGNHFIDTEANARASLLIHLLENNFITL